MHGLKITIINTAMERKVAQYPLMVYKELQNLNKNAEICLMKDGTILSLLTQRPKKNLKKPLELKFMILKECLKMTLNHGLLLSLNAIKRL